jgi:perosamine synthetase
MDLSLNDFLRALRAEGIPASAGYSPLNRMPYLSHAFGSKELSKRCIPADMLDYNQVHGKEPVP